MKWRKRRRRRGRRSHCSPPVQPVEKQMALTTKGNHLDERLEGGGWWWCRGRIAGQVEGVVKSLRKEGVGAAG